MSDEAGLRNFELEEVPHNFESEDPHNFEPVGVPHRQ